MIWMGLAVIQAAEPKVSNVHVEQRRGRMEFEIQYDLSSPGNASILVEVQVAEGAGKPWIALSRGLSGELGFPVPPGSGKRGLWRPDSSWVGRPIETIQFRIVAEIGIAGMVSIKPGVFKMGSPESESQRGGDEEPVTEVTLSRGFWLGKNEVTQREWQAVMGNNPSRFRGNLDLPVENVSWEDAMEYCRRLTQQEREAERLPAGYFFRLPTEAEWEYACRAGTRTPTAFGGRLGSTQANFDGDNPYNGARKGPNLERPNRVGHYEPNAWGLYDMHGNVWEWCLDWYRDRLPGGSVVDPTGTQVGATRVIRGGGWAAAGKSCRSAYRHNLAPTSRRGELGFRVACAPVNR